jgi:chloramphenicol 3-O phosphotransferase
VTPGTIVYLNGASSSGKTTLTRSLQELLPGPWLRVEGDAFFELLSRHEPWSTQAMVSLIHRTAASAAELGLSSVVDGVLLSRTWLKDAAEQLADTRAFFVGVRCSLEELERRELARGDRRAGNARYQVELVHEHGVYDLEVDTTEATPEACAALIADRLAGGPPTAFRRLRGSAYLRDEAAYGWVLLRGATGPGVERLQGDLRRLGHDPGPSDGAFGERTEAALRAFQEARGLPADGVLWPRIVRAILDETADRAAGSGRKSA